MLEFLNSITAMSVLRILGNEYRVKAKVMYVTETETTNWYAKLQLSDHHVLVVAPFDNYMYFGFIGEPLAVDFPTPEQIIYNGKVFKKEVEDYQLVKEFVFGDILTMEGEVRFADYSCGDALISMGIVARTQERADVYAQVIDLTDIEIVN